MEAILKMNYDERTTKEIGKGKKIYYQSMITLINNDGKSCRIWLNSDIDIKLARGIEKELTLKKYFKIETIQPKNLSGDEEPFDVYDTDIFYINGSEMVFIVKDKKLTLPISNFIIDSILMQYFLDIN